MDKKTYFIHALKAKCYYFKSWIIDCFAITSHVELPTTDNYPYRLATLTDGTRHYFIDGGWYPVTGGVSNEPLFDFYEPVVIDHLSGVDNYTMMNRGGDGRLPLETDYGTVLRNCVILCYPFGKKIPFQHHPFSIKKIEKEIAARLVDEPEEGEERDDKNIYPSELIKYSEAIGLIRGCSYFVSPSGSRGTMTVPDEVIALRDKLLEENKDKLHDPAVIAEIATQCAALDKEMMKDDPSYGYFTKDKLFNVVRMKMFIMLGIEPSLSSEVPTEPIVKSLAEGWDVENLVPMFNGLRYGSYARGKLTEFGGTVVKLMLQAFRDARVTEEDCGVKHGLPIVVRGKYINLLEGLYVTGSSSSISLSELQAKEGETLEFRSPVLCQAANNGVCEKCIGDNYAKNPRSVAIAMLTIGSIFMGRFMAAMHGKAMETRLLDVNDAFS